MPVQWPNPPGVGQKCFNGTFVTPPGSAQDLCWGLCQLNWRIGMQPHFWNFYHLMFLAHSKLKVTEIDTGESTV